MSRYECDFDAAGNAPPDAVASDQRDAIACFLSAGEGSSEAVKTLRGAFARQAVANPAGTGAGQDKREINHRTSEYLQWPGLKGAWTDND